MKLTNYLVALLLACLAANAHALVYKVGSGTGCTHSTLQAAVNAAAANAGYDTIRTTRSVAYNNIVVTMANQDLMIQGRWSTCSALTQDSTRTLLNGNNASSVLSISGSGTVILEGLEITNGNTSAYPTIPERRGGGIKIRQGATGSVVLQNLRLQQNSSASEGGAISVESNTTNYNNGSLLQIGADVEIRSNFAVTDAGGLACRNSRVEAISPRIEFFANNAGRNGGAIDAYNCLLTLASEGGAFNAMFIGNGATANGGALHMRDSVATAYSNRVDAPIRFYNNSAENGGAVYLAQGNRFTGYETRFENNRAYHGGGAFYQFSSDQFAQNELHLRRRRATGPGENCVSELCGTLVGNIARGQTSDPTLGAVLEVFSDAQGTSAVSVFAGQRISANVGRSLFTCNRFRVYLGTCRTVLENTVVAANASIFTYQSNAGARLEVINSTVALNATEWLMFDVYAESTNPSTIKIRNSLFAEATTARVLPSAAQAPLVSLDISYLITANATGIQGVPGTEEIHQAGVSFIDPAAGNYRVVGSVWLDFAAIESGQYSEGLDFTGAARSVDIPGVGFGGLTIQDFGAYEKSNDYLFANGFDR